MKVLIIDDTDYKIVSLKSLLAACDFVTEIHVARSFQTGTHLLEQCGPDLVLLDMTLPTTELDDGEGDGRTRLYGGKEILAEMKFLGLSAHVIIVTQFDHFGDPPNSVDLKTLMSQLKKAYPEMVIGGVYYSNIDSKWAPRLREMITSALRHR